MATNPNSGGRTTSRLAKFRHWQQRKHFARLRSHNSLFEPLDPRVTLTIDSNPNQPLPTGAEPLAVELGPIDADTIFDLAALSADGQLTVALHGGDDLWKNVATTDLGLGPLHGMTLSLIDNDPFSDVILQGPDSITLALGNANGQFAIAQTATPGAPGTLAPASGGRVGMDASLLDQNP